MKKFIVSSLIGFLILTFGAVSYAIDFKMSGFIDVSGQWGSNIFQPPYEVTGNMWGGRTATGATFTNGAGPLSNAIDHTRAWAEERARLRFDAIADKNLQGTLYFEIDSTRWGEPSGDRNRAGYWGADRSAFEVKNAYITFGVPWIPVPITMNVGIQPLAQRPGILVYNDGPGVTAGIKVDPAMIKLFWYKPVENQDYSGDDNDVYGIDVSAKIQTISVGGYVMHYNMNSYPQTSATTSAPTNRADITWFGLYAGGKVGPVNLSFDFAYDNGKVEDRRNALGPFLARDIDYSGWAILAKVDYPWEKLNFGATFIYGTGSDANKTNQSGVQDGSLTANGTIPKEVKGYVVPPGAEVGDDVSLLFFGVGPAGLNRGITGMLGSSGTTLNPGQAGGAWAIGPRISYQVTPAYKAEFRALYIGDTTKHGNTVASPLKNPLIPALGYQDDSEIGIEVNLMNYFKIYKNLLLNVGLAYLFAGDGMDYYDSATGLNKSPDDPWLVCTRLVYLF